MPVMVACAKASSGTTTQAATTATQIRALLIPMMAPCWTGVLMPTHASGAHVPGWSGPETRATACRRVRTNQPQHDAVYKKSSYIAGVC